ncbi:hypothetical protein AX16_008298 [Volvariella volvacea WC 439]|nr:hypothetical protein AX16_008298 [Volvariella volvacea WC 439]
MTERDIEVIDLTGLSDSDSEDSTEGVNRSENTENLRLNNGRDIPPSSHDDRDDDDEDDDGDDGDSEVEIPLTLETREHLKNAISNVSEARLRQVLIELVDTDQAVEAALMKEFVTIKRKSRDLIPRFEFCSNCEAEFDVDGPRSETECVFHPGELEVDEDAFVDWDEAAHGPKDRPDTRRDYPENFIWTCCDRDGTSDGCVQREHKVAMPRKRRRMES